MKEDIKQLQQTKHPNAYPTPPGNYRSFRTTNGLVICRRCHQVGHMPGKPAASKSPHALSESVTQLCTSRHLPTSSPIVCSQPLLAPLPPPTNILNALPIDHMPIFIILWDILTHKMPSIPIPDGHRRFSPPITPTKDTKLEDLTSQASITIIIT